MDKKANMFRLGLVENINLSYFPNLAERLKEDNIDLEEVAEDLSAGLTIERLENEETGEPYFCLRGLRFAVYANPRIGTKTNARLAFVSSVKRIEMLTRQGDILYCPVAFRYIWEEKPCDLMKIHPSKQEELEIHTALHSKVRRRYGALRSLMQLLEQRADIEQAAEARGEVKGSEIENGTTGISEIHRERTIVYVTSTTGKFDEGSLVEISKEGEEGKACTLLQEIEGNHFYLNSQDKIRLAPGDNIRIKRIPRFGMQRHSICLWKFLQEEVEGSWEDLARLLCNPGSLPPIVPIMPERFFCDEDANGHFLNEEQRKAVAGALSTPHTFFIQGPPGTGKTTVISEIIRQLTEREERVLFLASTHVAVDEVLIRIGKKDGIMAVREAWSDEKVREDVRRYMRPKVKGEFVKKIRRPSMSRARQWEVKEKELVNELKKMDRLLQATQARTEAIRVEKNKRKELEVWRETYRHKQEQLSSKLSEVIRLLETNSRELESVETYVKKTELRLNKAREEQRRWGRIIEFFGIGKVAKLKKELAGTQRDYDKCAKRQIDLSKEKSAIEKSIKDFEEKGFAKEKTLTQELEEAVAAQKEAEREWQQASRALGGNKEMSLEELTARRVGLYRQLKAIEHYPHLEQRWFELTGMAGTDDEATVEQIVEQIGDDLLQSVNLVCCTTVGIAGSPFAREADFDTLIIDEASRVTDSEFLIGAIKARRWVLVGDEHQLPPYVDQADEHHLHALAALHKVERGDSPTLEEAVDKLAVLWKEDEELHRFRKEAVSKVAERLRAEGTWEKEYRSTFEEAYRYFEERGGDADRELLQTMIRYLVRSLFERCVNKDRHLSMRQRLVVQRRMIDPIAEIVREQIYEGEYQSPSEDDLRSCGVMPLTTTTFNRPIIFLDTSLQGKKAAEKLVGNGFINRLECDWIVSACKDYERELRARKEPECKASVLCFYRAQAQEIRRRLGSTKNFPDFSKLQFQVIDAIDKIQGQESDLVFISFCRAKIKDRPGPGFGQWLQDLRRLNVACTRAHRALVFVGHLRTLKELCSYKEARSFYANLFKLFKERPDVMRIISDYKGGRSL